MRWIWGRLALPTGPGRVAAKAATVSWVGVVVGGLGEAGIALGIAAAALSGVVTRRVLPMVLVVGAVLSGCLAAARVEATLGTELPAGPTRLHGRVADEPTSRDGFSRFVLQVDCRSDAEACVAVRWPPVAVELEGPAGVTVGDRVAVSGKLVGRPGRVRGDPVAGRIAEATLERLPSDPNPLLLAGNVLRAHVTRRLDGKTPAPAAALMAGLLIGDTSAMPAADLDALQRSGLTHFVAVSGSNVALFLAGWWLVGMPLLSDPRRRGLWGLVGLALFVVVTRWEASVIRAATMAGLVLVGRALAVPIDAWTALGTAVVGLLLLAGDLGTNVGFQLSVAATAGVLAGARVFADRRPAFLWTVVGATASAQVAVTPLLLLHFGEVPLLSPVANVMAAPLVLVATIAGGVGTLTSFEPAMRGGLVAADLVLGVARLASGWPQLGWAGVVAVLAVLLAMRKHLLRPAALVAAGLIVFAAAGPYRAPETDTVTVLDVGQGDAVLLRSADGQVMLVDGGRHPELLHDKLRDRGIDRLDVLVVTHGDEDHIGGLSRLAGHVPVAELWIPDQPQGLELEALVAASTSYGTKVRRLRAPAAARLGSFTLEVLGPVRRYAGENDGSIVLLVQSGTRRMLLAGDIEAVAQADVPPPSAHVMLVPHHGAATSDIEWLRGVGVGVALVSVGPNNYGHPSPIVLEALEASGARIRQTRYEGDLLVRFP